MCLINYNNAWIGECIWYCKVTSRLLNIYHHEAYPPLICWQWTILNSGQSIPNTISKFRAYKTRDKVWDDFWILNVFQKLNDKEENWTLDKRYLKFDSVKEVISLHGDK